MTEPDKDFLGRTIYSEPRDMPRATAWVLRKGQRVAEIFKGIPSDIEFVKWAYAEWKGRRR